MSEADDEAIFEQAAIWCGRVRSGEIYDFNAFEDWLAEDQRHRSAYDEALSAWDMFNSDPAAAKLLAMRSEALADAHRAGAGQWRKRWSVDRRTLVAGLTAALVVPVVGIFAVNHADAHDYSTGIGEQRDIDLPDGSKMFLDANSTARTSFSMTGRSIDLIRGRAKFTVAKHKSATFQVKAGAKTVTATGTAFTAEYRHDVLEVVLLEGSVTVDGDGQRRKMVPPQVLSWRGSADPVMTIATDGGKATSWQNGELFFENTRLADAADRLNDYSKTKLEIADERTGDLRISGMFMAGKTDQFVDAVKNYYPVDIAMSEGTVTLKSKP